MSVNESAGVTVLGKTQRTDRKKEGRMFGQSQGVKSEAQILHSTFFFAFFSLIISTSQGDIIESFQPTI
jgi:hypothetical protein